MKGFLKLSMICVMIILCLITQVNYVNRRGFLIKMNNSHTTVMKYEFANITEISLGKGECLDANLTTTNQSCNEHNSTKNKVEIAKSETRMKIGILIPSTTRNIKITSLEALALTKICLPSVYRTLENIYQYTIYVGIDKNDSLETIIDQLEKFDKVKAVVSPGQTFTKSVNAMARKAYQDGMDYLVRINDDSSFETKDWASKGISVLQAYRPTNIGVVGPTCHEGNTGILTHDMVHRTHIEIFDFYYPTYFDNWWADDWITQVYSPNRTTKLSSWVMKHHLTSHGTRYRVDMKQYGRLEKTVAFDKNRLISHLSRLNQTNTVL